MSEIIYLLNQVVKEIINECEVLLQVNSAKNQRISKNLVETVINNKFDYILSENKNLTGGNDKETQNNFLQLPNEVDEVSYYE